VDGPVYNYVGHAKQLLMVDYPDPLIFDMAMVYLPPQLGNWETLNLEYEGCNCEHFRWFIEFSLTSFPAKWYWDTVIFEF
jgi:hypothetical protein